MFPGFRRINNLVHRYLGYGCVGLTLVYAVSGMALNHAHQFNPDYVVRSRSMAIEAPERGVSLDYFRGLGEKAGIGGRIKGIIPAGEGSWRVVFDGATVIADTVHGRMEIREKRPRPVLRPLNFLHLNQPRAAWTVCADLYCLALVLLAVTGLFARPGAFRGAAGIAVLAGALVPLLFLWFYY